MRLIFPDVQNLNFTSSSQRIRVVSELWFSNEMYCPACGCDSLTKMPNNSRVADFYCDNCGEIYELKSKGSPIGKSILDEAYYTALESYLRSAKLRLDNMNLRGWMLDILLCLDKIAHEIFSLDDVYKFKAELAIKHAGNRNITAKIRQQLQFLRDKGFIEFLGHGVYRKI